MKIQRDRIRAQELYLEKASADTKTLRLQTVNLRNEHQSEVDRWSNVKQSIMLEKVASSQPSILCMFLCKLQEKNAGNAHREGLEGGLQAVDEPETGDGSTPFDVD